MCTNSYVCDYVKKSANSVDICNKTCFCHIYICFDFIFIPSLCTLTLKAPITNAADKKICDTFPNLQQKYGMIFHENRLPADDSHEV